MFREIKRKEKTMGQEGTNQILNEGLYGTLASIGENGYPYSTPLNYVYENGEIYFHSAHNGNKVENIKLNNKVSFSVVSYHKILPDKFDTEYDSAVLYGKAYQIMEDTKKKKALMLLIKKYSKNFTNQGLEYISKAIDKVSVFRIEIEHMTGKKGR